MTCIQSNHVYKCSYLFRLCPSGKRQSLSTDWLVQHKPKESVCQRWMWSAGREILEQQKTSYICVPFMTSMGPLRKCSLIKLLWLILLSGVSEFLYYFDFGDDTAGIFWLTTRIFLRWSQKNKGCHLLKTSDLHALCSRTRIHVRI